MCCITKNVLPSMKKESKGMNENVLCIGRDGKV